MYTLEDYFSLEEGSTVHHEFFKGEIFAMAGGTLAHNVIAANLLRELGNALRDGPCRSLGSDMRLLTPDGLITYPDVMVICGEAQLGQGRADVVTNPILLVEVLSPATRAYDLGEKLELYRAIPSLRHFLAIEQDRRCVQSHSRAQNRWQHTEYREPDAVLPLPSLGISLDVAALYEKAFDL